LTRVRERDGELGSVCVGVAQTWQIQSES